MSMNYSERDVINAFQIYSVLARDGTVGKEYVQLYRADEKIRHLLDTFAREVDCVLIGTSEQLFLIPETKLSTFHVSNDWIKRRYLRSGATNGDIYLLYFATLILFGKFYDSYQSQTTKLSFLSIEEWVRSIQERIDQLKTHDEETLKQYEREYSYNWRLIIEKWEDMDDIKESAKRQTGNTISRFSFTDTARRFLIDQELIEDIGNDEITLTEKAKTIVERYFMELEYNKNIFSFIYSFEEEKLSADN